MSDVKTLPINEKILFHAHMLAQLCEGKYCESCPLSEDNGDFCLLQNVVSEQTRDEIERRFEDARNKRNEK